MTIPVPVCASSRIPVHRTGRQAQLQALLAMTRANAGDAFRCMGAEYRENYLWTCSMIADEARKLVEAIEARKYEERKSP